jgi:ATP-dependent helicase/nuclease subunit A
VNLSPAELLAIDRRSRLRSIEPTGRLLLQAPAGSGKTTLLTQRFLSLLAVVNEPEEILALTFTRKAAEEMSVRIGAALRASAEQRRPADEAAALTWDLARRAREHLDALGIDILAHPARLSVSTLDGFNARLAGAAPITSGSGGRLRITDDSTPLYAEAARRAIESAREDPELAGCLAIASAAGDGKWQRLHANLMDLLPKRNEWLQHLLHSLRITEELSADAAAEIRREFDGDLRALIERAITPAREMIGDERLGQLGALMRGAAGRIEDPSPDWLLWRDDARGTRGVADDVGRWRAIAALLTTQGGSWRKSFDARVGFPAKHPDKDRINVLAATLSDNAALCEAIAALRSLPPAYYDDAAWRRVLGIARLLLHAAAELVNLFRERGAADYPAVEAAASQALGGEEAPSDLNLALDARIKHVLIDEFQDTSLAQFRLLEKLLAGSSEGDGKTVFCVGDPMQSIYGFRQAEVRLFLELGSRGLAGVRFETLPLYRNFRSTASIIAWTNTTFARILPRRDDVARGAIAFRPAVPGGERAAEGGPGVHWHRFATAEAEAQWLAESLAARLRQVPQLRIGILGRTRLHLSPISAALVRERVPHQARDIEPLGERQVVRDIAILARALLHFDDRSAWLALLRAPWCGLSLADLHVLADAGTTIWESMHCAEKLARLSAEGALRVRRLTEVIGASLRARGEASLARWLERTWYALGGPAAALEESDLGSARLTFEHLEAIDPRDLPDVAEFESCFGNLHASRAVPAGIELMTIHGAKGLEFDIVVLPGLARAPHSSPRSVFEYHAFARRGGQGLVMAVRDAAARAADPLSEFLRREDQESARLESQRLLYVACTRAKRELLLCAYPLDPQDDANEDRDEAASHASARIARRGSLLDILGEAELPVACTDVRLPEVRTTPTPQYRRFAAGFAPPPLAIKLLRGTLADLQSDSETPPFDWAGEIARQIGVLVHAELQDFVSSRPRADDITARRPDYARWLADCGVPAERLGEAVDRVQAALVGVLNDPRAAWILFEPHREARSELALTGVWQGEMLTGVLDRSFVDSDNVRWIVDFKTSTHSGAGLDEFLDREVARYAPQLARYALLARGLGPEPVRAGLYFPLLGAWREFREASSVP